MITRMFAGLLKRLEFWVFAFAMAILVPEVWAHWFEARFKPVITRLEITSIQADPEGSVLAGHARRLRNCNWVETRWWLGRRGAQRVPVEVRFRDPPQIRATGDTSWTGIVIVALTAEQVLRHSHADVIYRCYGGIWSAVETIVPFYDGLGQDQGLVEADRQRELLDAVEGLSNQVNQIER